MGLLFRGRKTSEPPAEVEPSSVEPSSSSSSSDAAPIADLVTAEAELADAVASAAASPTPVRVAPPPPAAPDIRLEIAMSASGWLFIYYCGVVRALRDYHLAPRVVKCRGSSGGALVGTLLFLPVKPDLLKDYILDCASQSRSSLRGPFRVREYVRGSVERFAGGDAHTRLTGKLELSVTRLPLFANARIAEYGTHAALMDALLASSLFVPLAGLPRRLAGHGYAIDGGISDISWLSGFAPGGSFNKLHAAPVAGRAVPVSPRPSATRLVTVCPFYSSRADIAPSRFVPLWWLLLPPSTAQMESLFWLGYHDTLAWATKHGLATLGPPDSMTAAEAAEHAGCACDQISLGEAWARAQGPGAAGATGPGPARAALWRLLSALAQLLRPLLCLAVLLELHAQAVGAAAFAACATAAKAAKIAAGVGRAASVPTVPPRTRVRDLWRASLGLYREVLSGPVLLFPVPVLGKRAGVDPERLRHLSLFYRLLGHVL